MDEEYRKVYNMSLLANDIISGIRTDIGNSRGHNYGLLVRILDRLIQEEGSTVWLKPDEIFYRARIYEEADAETAYNSQIGKQFAGYNEKGSFVNEGSPGEGRCNKEGIPCLYIANSRECCLHEINARYGQYINMAEIQIVKDVKILNFATDEAHSRSYPKIVNGTGNTMLYMELFRQFILPKRQVNGYYFSQMIAKELQARGYDGVGYYSSVYPGKGRNTNYAIFNYNKCKAINSRLHIVYAVNIEYM